MQNLQEDPKLAEIPGLGIIKGPSKGKIHVLRSAKRPSFLPAWGYVGPMDAPQPQLSKLRFAKLVLGNAALSSPPNSSHDLLIRKACLVNKGSYKKVPLNCTRLPPSVQLR